MNRQFFLRRSKKILGPFSLEDISKLKNTNRLKKGDQISVNKDGPWKPIADLEDQENSSLESIETSNKSSHESPKSAKKKRPDAANRSRVREKNEQLHLPESEKVAVNSRKAFWGLCLVAVVSFIGVVVFVVSDMNNTKQVQAIENTNKLLEEAYEELEQSNLENAAALLQQYIDDPLANRIEDAVLIRQEIDSASSDELAISVLKNEELFPDEIILANFRKNSNELDPEKETLLNSRIEAIAKKQINTPSLRGHFAKTIKKNLPDHQVRRFAIVLAAQQKEAELLAMKEQKEAEILAIREQKEKEERLLTERSVELFFNDTATGDLAEYIHSKNEEFGSGVGQLRFGAETDNQDLEGVVILENIYLRNGVWLSFIQNNDISNGETRLYAILELITGNEKKIIPPGIFLTIGKKNGPEIVLMREKVEILREAESNQVIGHSIKYESIYGLINKTEDIEGFEYPWIVATFSEMFGDATTEFAMTCLGQDGELVEDAEVGELLYEFKGTFNDATLFVIINWLREIKFLEVTKMEDSWDFIPNFHEDLARKEFQIKNRIANEKERTLKDDVGNEDGMNENPQSEYDLLDGVIQSFSFDEDTVDQDLATVEDISGKGSKGFTHGTKTVPGFIGNCLRFWNRACLTFEDSHLPSGLEPRTISFWIKMQPQLKQRGIPFTYGNGADDAFTLIVFENVNPVVEFRRTMTLVQAGDDRPIANVSSKTRIADNEWHHIVATYDGLKAAIFIDGQLEADQKIFKNTTLPGQAVIGNLQIGNKEHFYDGLLDEFMIYNRAITPAEVKKLYDSVLARSENLE